jgi:FKBP-type peptidyl-prolyl cis-trans isomerase
VPKILTAITLAGVVALSLVACSTTGAHDGSTTASSTCVPTKAGTASDAVKVSGKFGTEPKVTFATPLTTTKTERTVDSKGSGTAALANSAVKINYSVYNATSGKQIDTTGFGKDKAQPLTLTSGSIIPGLYKTILCAPAGSRVSAVIPPADAFGTGGQPSLGIAATDSIVFVLDVVSATKPVKALAKANGVEQPAPKGYPTVKLGTDGAPTITVPKADAPTTLEIADLKKGSGATVKKGATVTVHYTGVIWATGKTFDSSWTGGQPATFTTDGVVPGFGAALVGQKVGSQVIAVIPPAQGYGATPPAGSGISATDTLVFVIDILATQ